MAILALNKTNINVAVKQQAAAATKPPKKKRVVKKAPTTPNGTQRCVSPKDVSPPPLDGDSQHKKAAGKKVTAATMDPETLADKRARNKIAAEKVQSIVTTLDHVFQDV